MTGLLSPSHIIVLLIVLLLVFGAKRLPELGRSLGSGMREFKHSIDTEHPDEPPTLAAAPAPTTGTPAVQPITAPAVQTTPVAQSDADETPVSGPAA